MTYRKNLFPRFILNAQGARVEKARSGAVVDSLHHRLVAFQPAFPNPLVLPAHLFTALLLGRQANVPQRLFLVRQSLAGILIEILLAAFVKPLSRGGFLLVLKCVVFLRGEVQQSLRGSAALFEAG